MAKDVVAGANEAAQWGFPHLASENGFASPGRPNPGLGEHGEQPDPGEGASKLLSTRSNSQPLRRERRRLQRCRRPCQDLPLWSTGRAAIRRGRGAFVIPVQSKDRGKTLCNTGMLRQASRPDVLSHRCQREAAIAEQDSQSKCVKPVLVGLGSHSGYLQPSS